MSARTFRVLLLAYVVLVAAAAMMQFATYGLPATQDSLPLLKDWWVDAIVVLWCVGQLVGLVGLFLFRKWARSLCVLLTVIDLFMRPFYGPLSPSAWATAFGDASTTLWGMVLAVSLFSPLSACFGTGK